MKSFNKLAAGRQAILPADTESEKTAAESRAAAERHRRISERAYFRAAARGFVGDLQIEDWLVAEREIDTTAAALPDDTPAQSPAQPPGVGQNPRNHHGPSKARSA
jgi:Protein of unknown function (DUF2934)